MFREFLDILFPPRATDVLVRTLGTDELMLRLAPKATEHGIIALLSYDDPVVRAAILEAKFHDNALAVHLLGKVLAGYLAEELVDRDAYERSSYTLIPIPLSRERFRERGYNQAERVAKVASTLLTIPVETNLLVRTRNTPPQTSLDGTARRRNVERAFAVTRAPNPNSIYIVIDDVVTTGTTMEEAVKILGRSSLLEIWKVALAY